MNSIISKALLLGMIVATTASGVSTVVDKRYRKSKKKKSITAENCFSNLDRLDDVQELGGETIYNYEGSGKMFEDKTFHG